MTLDEMNAAWDATGEDPEVKAIGLAIAGLSQNMDEMEQHIQWLHSSLFDIRLRAYRRLLKEAGVTEPQ